MQADYSGSARRGLWKSPTVSKGSTTRVSSPPKGQRDLFLHMVDESRGAHALARGAAPDGSYYPDMPGLRSVTTYPHMRRLSGSDTL